MDVAERHAPMLKEHVKSNQQLVNMVLKLSTTWNLIEKHLEIMLDGSKDDMQPVLEPYDDAQLAHGIARAPYENAKAGEVEEWRLERLRQYIDQAANILQVAQQGQMEAQAQAQAAAHPQAAPEPPPTSPLLPNAPGAQA